MTGSVGGWRAIVTCMGRRNVLSLAFFPACLVLGFLLSVAAMPYGFAVGLMLWPLGGLALFAVHLVSMLLALLLRWPEQKPLLGMTIAVAGLLAFGPVCQGMLHIGGGGR